MAQGPSVPAAFTASAHNALPPLAWRVALHVPPCDSAGRLGVQPAAEPRHVPRHEHALHVYGAPPARAIWPQSPLGPSVHAACTATTLHALPPLSPRVPPSTCLCVTLQGASAFNQPLSFDTSSVTKMRGMFRVRPPRACRAPQCPIGSSVHAVCTATAPHALAPPSPGLAPRGLGRAFLYLSIYLSR